MKEAAKRSIFRQRCAVKEPDVYVRGENIYVAEGRIPQTCHRATVMQKLLDSVPHCRITSNH
jgi:hypothetical protein